MPSRLLVRFRLGTPFQAGVLRFSVLDPRKQSVGIAVMSTMSTPSEWRGFLEKFAAAVGALEWPGSPSASEEELLVAEKRLKTNLPPSYRAFLSVSNGWSQASRAVPVLRPVEKIRWFGRQQPEWVRAYQEPMRGIDPPVLA